MQIFDSDAGITLNIDYMEFCKTIRSFKFTGPVSLINGLFESLDSDASGSISYDDFFEFVRGYKHSLDTRYKTDLSEVRLEPLPQKSPTRRKIRIPPSFTEKEQPSTEKAQPLPSPENEQPTSMEKEIQAGEEFVPTLGEIDWDGEALRVLIKQMMERCSLTVGDLLKGFDTDKRDKRNIAVDKSEFLLNISRLACDAPDAEFLWKTELKPVAEAAFDEILKGVRGGLLSLSSEAGVIHIEKWLREPPRSPELPLKSPAMMRRQATLSKLAKQPPPPPRKVDNTAIAQEGIIRAAAKARMLRDARSIALVDEQQQAQRWRRSQGRSFTSPEKHGQPPLLTKSLSEMRPFSPNVRHATLKRRALHAEYGVRETELSHAKSWYMNEQQPDVTISRLRRTLGLTSSMSLPSLMYPAPNAEEHIAQVKREMKELKEEHKEIVRNIRAVSAQGRRR